MFLSSYRNTVINQSARVFSLSYFLNGYKTIELNNYRQVKFNGFKKYYMNTNIKLKKKNYTNINTELNQYIKLQNIATIGLPF